MDELKPHCLKHLRELINGRCYECLEQVLDEAERALALAWKALLKIPVRNKLEEEAFINVGEALAAIKIIRSGK